MPSMNNFSRAVLSKLQTIRSYRSHFLQMVSCHRTPLNRCIVCSHGKVVAWIINTHTHPGRTQSCYRCGLTTPCSCFCCALDEMGRPKWSTGTRSNTYFEGPILWNVFLGENKGPPLSLTVFFKTLWWWYYIRSQQKHLWSLSRILYHFKLGIKLWQAPLFLWSVSQ